MHMENILPTPPDRRVARFLDHAAVMSRKQIGTAIDGLIAILDARDGDTDLEAEVDKGVDDEGEPGNWAEWDSPGLVRAYSDDDEIEDRATLTRHRDRIRRTRCVPERAWWGVRRYHIDGPTPVHPGFGKALL